MKVRRTGTFECMSPTPCRPSGPFGSWRLENPDLTVGATACRPSGPQYKSVEEFEMLRTFASADVTTDGIINRRGFIKSLAVAGGAGAMTLSWRDMLIARAEELRKQGKSMILLWMDGGPSQWDTFNPKPESQYQGPAKPIATNVPGIEIAEYWPHTAKVMDKIALIRSMQSDERDHFRAIKLVRTGYPIKPTINYPTWGAVVARHRYDPLFDL